MRMNARLNTTFSPITILAYIPLRREFSRWPWRLHVLYPGFFALGLGGIWAYVYLGTKNNLLAVTYEYQNNVIELCIVVYKNVNDRIYCDVRMCRKHVKGQFHFYNNDIFV